MVPPLNMADVNRKRLPYLMVAPSNAAASFHFQVFQTSGAYPTVA